MKVKGEKEARRNNISLEQQEKQAKEQARILGEHKSHYTEHRHFTISAREFLQPDSRNIVCDVKRYIVKAVQDADKVFDAYVAQIAKNKNIDPAFVQTASARENVQIAKIYLPVLQIDAKTKERHYIVETYNSETNASIDRQTKQESYVKRMQSTVAEKAYKDFYSMKPRQPEELEQDFEDGNRVVSCIGKSLGKIFDSSLGLKANYVFSTQNIDANFFPVWEVRVQHEDGCFISLVADDLQHFDLSYKNSAKTISKIQRVPLQIKLARHARLLSKFLLFVIPAALVLGIAITQATNGKMLGLLYNLLDSDKPLNSISDILQQTATIIVLSLAGTAFIAQGVVYFFTSTQGIKGIKKNSDISVNGNSLPLYKRCLATLLTALGAIVVLIAVAINLPLFALMCIPVAALIKLIVWFFNK